MQLDQGTYITLCCSNWTHEPQMGMSTEKGNMVTTNASGEIYSSVVFLFQVMAFVLSGCVVLLRGMVSNRIGSLL